MDRHGPHLKGRRIIEAVLAASLLCALSIIVVGRPHAPAAGLKAMAHTAFQPAMSLSVSPSLVSLGSDLHPTIHTPESVGGQGAAQPGG